MTILLSIDHQNAPPLDAKLAKFGDLQNQLLQAIENDDEVQVGILDEHIRECWLGLLDCVPRNDSEQFSLIEFFLDQIIENPGSGELIIQSKDRVLKLATSRP